MAMEDDALSDSMGPYHIAAWRRIFLFSMSFFFNSVNVGPYFIESWVVPGEHRMPTADKRPRAGRQPHRHAIAAIGTATGAFGRIGLSTGWMMSDLVVSSLNFSFYLFGRAFSGRDSAQGYTILLFMQRKSGGTMEWHFEYLSIGIFYHLGDIIHGRTSRYHSPSFARFEVLACYVLPPKN